MMEAANLGPAHPVVLLISQGGGYSIVTPQDIVANREINRSPFAVLGSRAKSQYHGQAH
jgi:hypothetical protein